MNKAITSLRVLVALALLLPFVLEGCAQTTTKRSRTQRDPYATHSSSDPQIRVGNPY